MVAAFVSNKISSLVAKTLLSVPLWAIPCGTAQTKVSALPMKERLSNVFCVLMIMLFVLPYTAFAQTQATVSHPRSTTTASITTSSISTSSGASLKSLLAERRNLAATAQTLTLYTPLPAHGRLFLTGTNAFLTIAKQDIQWLDYNGMAEILAAKMPVFPLFQGYQGAFNHISFLGSSARDVAVMMNGRPVNDAALGAAYIEHLAPEMMEQAEIYIGSDAALLANNAAGAAINLQEIRHNTKDLYVRAWYAQANEQYTAADVDLSHNIAPNLNLTIGARTQFGNRIYNNTGVSAWTARSILRWNVSSSANISLSYLLTQHRVALSGGVTNGDATSATVLDFSTSATVFNETRENTFRHDLTLTGSAYLSRDSAVAASLSVYATLNERAIERARLQGTGLSGVRSFSSALSDTLIAQSTTQSFSVGATGRIETKVTLFNALEAALTAGGNIGWSSVGQSVYWDESLRDSAFRAKIYEPRSIKNTETFDVSAFGRLQFNLLESVKASGGVRFAFINNELQPIIGAKVSSTLLRNTTTTLEVWGDLSNSFRTPSLAERGMFVTTPTVRMLKAENHFLVLGGLRLRENLPQSTFSCDVLAGVRNIGNEIVSQPITVDRFLHGTQNTVSLTNRLPTMQTGNTTASRTIFGASVMADWHVQNVLFGGNFVFSGFAQCTLPIEDIAQNIARLTTLVPERVPLLYAGCTAQYEYVVGRSILRAGVRVRLSTPFQPQVFTPTTWSYSDTDITQGLTGNGLDIVVAARVGNAYIRATYQNVLNIPAMNVAIYPQYPSNIRVSVALTIAE